MYWLFFYLQVKQLFWCIMFISGCKKLKKKKKKKILKKTKKKKGKKNQTVFCWKKK